jgi:hypothetical protein
MAVETWLQRKVHAQLPEGFITPIKYSGTEAKTKRPPKRRHDRSPVRTPRLTCQCAWAGWGCSCHTQGARVSPHAPETRGL